MCDEFTQRIDEYYQLLPLRINYGASGEQEPYGYLHKFMYVYIYTRYQFWSSNPQV